jgi:hypothetical protein
MKSIIDVQKLVNITIEEAKNQGLITIDLSKKTQENSNLIKRICQKYFKDRLQLKHIVNICSWWKRNTYNFKNIVSKRLQISDNIEFKIQFDCDMWNEKIVKLIGIYQRSKFKKDFDYFLNQKLKLIGFKCWFQCRYNWFSSLTSKNKSFYWKGKYNCIDPTCNMKIEAYIKDKIDKNENVDIFIKVNGDCNHKEQVCKTARSTGEERKSQANQIMSNGISICVSNNTLTNKYDKPLKYLVTNNKTLSKIKEEFLNQNKLSKEILIDAKLTKQVFDFMYHKIDYTNIEGYIHELTLDPFGFLLISDLQVKKLIILFKKRSL